MISVNYNMSNSKSLSFQRKKNQTKKSFCDDFIRDIKKEEKQLRRGSWFQRNAGTYTGAIPLLLADAYALYAILKMHKLDKTLPVKEITDMNNRYIKRLATALLTGTGFSLIINKYINSKTDSKYQKIRDEFNKINDTNAELAESMCYSNYIGALYDPISGVIRINKNIVNDPIKVRNINKKIKHELVHARQYETVARSKDGIGKINFAVISTIKKNILRKPGVKEYMDAMYEEIQNNPEKYNNVKIPFNGGTSEVYLTKYVEAMHIVLNNQDVRPDDVPIIIDAEHYQKVIDKKGPLSAEEEKKANVYYEAMLNYTVAKYADVFNPLAPYRQNILEKEAYRENPSLMSKLAEILGKNNS